MKDKNLYFFGTLKICIFCCGFIKSNCNRNQFHWHLMSMMEVLCLNPKNIWFWLIYYCSHLSLAIILAISKAEELSVIMFKVYRHNQPNTNYNNILYRHNVLKYTLANNTGYYSNEVHPKQGQLSWSIAVNRISIFFTARILLKHTHFRMEAVKHRTQLQSMLADVADDQNHVKVMPNITGAMFYSFCHCFKQNGLNF